MLPLCEASDNPLIFMHNSVNLLTFSASILKILKIGRGNGVAFQSPAVHVGVSVGDQAARAEQQ
jgi:hypothetical protein